ncbi:hypothetical protein Vafri_1158 [Volvox africanus]|nr:hypothetical protein Vafri_1158 [Volvox africanus]
MFKRSAAPTAMSRVSALLWVCKSAQPPSPLAPLRPAVVRQATSRELPRSARHGSGDPTSAATSATSPSAATSATPATSATSAAISNSAIVVLPAASPLPA